MAAYIFFWCVSGARYWALFIYRSGGVTCRSARHAARAVLAALVSLLTAMSASQSSSIPTMSETFQSRSVTPAAIAGVTHKV
jgi:hypothetical protein